MEIKSTNQTTNRNNEQIIYIISFIHNLLRHHSHTSLTF